MLLFRSIGEAVPGSSNSSARTRDVFAWQRFRRKKKPLMRSGQGRLTYRGDPCSGSGPKHRSGGGAQDQLSAWSSVTFFEAVCCTAFVAS